MIIEIGKCLVSTEILTEFFCCDYSRCKGCCCVVGDSGAPLEDGEARSLESQSADYDSFLAADGKPDVEKMELITFDPVHHTYIQLGKTVGKAFADGAQLK